MANTADSASYERLANDVYLYGSVSLALAMAKETGMIQGLCTATGPLSSADLATQLQLKERYVREVLNSLTVAGLVQLEEGTGGKEGVKAKYLVPPSCRPALQRAGVNSVMISFSARQFAAVRKCFDLNGPDSAAMSEESESYDTLDEWALAHMDCITEKILETPGLKEGLETGLQALEVGCGTGRVFLHLAAMFPKSHFTLTDLEPQAMQIARQRAEEQALTNVSFQTLDVLQVPDDLKEKFDWLLTAYVIHDLPHPLEALKGVHKALKPGGHYSLVDMFVSTYVSENVKSWKAAAALYSMGTFSCIPESCHQSQDSEAPGFCWGEEKATELVKAAGMKVLRLGRSEALNSTAVCMCQKPE